MAFEQITDVVAFHAEGPVWHESWGGLRFVDMLAGDILTMDDGGKVSRLATDSKIAAFVRPRVSGGYVVGTEKGIAVADTPMAAPTERVRLLDGDTYRMNEGGVDPWGYLYGGCMPYTRNEETINTAKLWRISPDGQATEILGNVTTSNGIDFSPNNKLAYYNDTTTRGTDVFDVDDAGNLHNRRQFAASGGPSPDGLTVDSEGNVWVAMNRAGQIRVYDPAGKVVQEYQLPVTGTTAVTLGGKDGKDIFVTVSRENDDSPGAGAVWWMESPVAGQPTRSFAG